MVKSKDTLTNVVATLVNAVDSSDIQEFESCEDAATYATENSEINWELTIKSGEVPSSCFAYLTNLVSLTIEEGVTSIGASAFRDCSGLTGSLTIPSSVTSIGAYAFRNCSGFTGPLTIPGSVTSIDISAFYGCTGFDDNLSYYGTSNPSTYTDVFSYSSFTKCSVPEGYVDDNFCGLPVSFSHYLTVSPTSHDFGTDVTSRNFAVGLGNEGVWVNRLAITVDSSSAWTVEGVPDDMQLTKDVISMVGKEITTSIEEVSSGSAGTTTIYLHRNSTDLDGTAVITFKNSDGDEATLEVTREKVTYLTLSESTLAFDSNTSQLSFTLNSSSAWKLKSSVSGFSVSPSSGEAGTTTVTVTCSLSTSASATLTFENEDGDTATVKVTFSAPYITASQSSVSLDRTTSSVAITISSSSAWTVSQSGTGVNVSPTSGSSGIVEVFITSTEEEGETTLTFTNTEGKSVSVSVSTITA